MTAKRKEEIWYCDNGDCRRPMDRIIMTEMRKPDVDEPLRICNAPDCWDYAEAMGYTSEHQARYRS